MDRSSGSYLERPFEQTHKRTVLGHFRERLKDDNSQIPLSSLVIGLLNRAIERSENRYDGARSVANVKNHYERIP
jgi:hypothetical protein